MHTIGATMRADAAKNAPKSNASGFWHLIGAARAASSPSIASADASIIRAKMKI
jgi:hypothetical protein